MYKDIKCQKMFYKYSRLYSIAKAIAQHCIFQIPDVIVDSEFFMFWISTGYTVYCLGTVVVLQLFSG